MASESQRLVLIVDDDASVRDMVGAMLRNFGFAVITAAGGNEALQYAREYKDRLDLLVTDLEMREVDGLTVASQVLQVCPRTRVLLMSGCSDLLGQAKATRWAFLAKPFEMNALLHSVEQALSTGPDTEANIG